MPAELIVWGVATLAEGLGIRAVARVFELDPNTVLQWLVEAADHAAAFSHSFLHDVRVDQVQLDELYALLSAVKTGQLSEVEALPRLSRSPHWVWGAIDLVTKLLLALDIGDRTLEMAQRLVHGVMEVLAPGCVPLFPTDGFKEYATALLTHFGSWVQPPRRQATGPVPKLRWMPMPQLRYAQVVKCYRRRRVVRVRHRVVFGTLAGVNRVLATTGWQINTAFIERLNLTIRQHVAAVCRRLSKKGSSASLVKPGRSDLMNHTHALQAPPPERAEAQAAAGCVTSERCLPGFAATVIRWKIRGWSRSSFARPSPNRFISCTRQICPSPWPVLQGLVSAAIMAA